MVRNEVLISVVVAIYNMDQYLNRCLDSLRNQTFKEFEVILVDDGSTDDSLAICQKMSSEDNRFKVIHQQNGGVASARRTGLNNSIGDYVIHVDPDDHVASDMLEGLYRCAEETNSDMVICDYYEETEKGLVYKTQQPTSLECNNLILQLFNSLHGSCWNKLVRRDVIQRYGISFPPLSLCEDTYFCVSLLMHPLKVSYLNKAYYHYNRINVNSVTWRGNPNTGLFAYQACIEFRKLLYHDNLLWSAFIRYEMPWMAYLTLYYGSVSKSLYCACYKELRYINSSSRNGELVKKSLTHYYTIRLYMLLRRIAGKLFRFVGL